MRIIHYLLYNELAGAKWTYKCGNSKEMKLLILGYG
jgi:hypothetical protein